MTPTHNIGMNNFYTNASGLIMTTTHDIEALLSTLSLNAYMENTYYNNTDISLTEDVFISAHIYFGIFIKTHIHFGIWETQLFQVVT